MRTILAVLLVALGLELGFFTFQAGVSWHRVRLDHATIDFTSLPFFCATHDEIIVCKPKYYDL